MTTISYRGTHDVTIADGAGSFNADLGVAAADRLIVVFSNTGASGLITSVTVNGYPLTLFTDGIFFYGFVPDGTEVTISVTAAVSMTAKFGLWAITGTDGVVADSAYNWTFSATPPLALDCDTISGSAIVCLGLSAFGVGLSGVDVDAAIGSNFCAGSAIGEEEETPRSISVTGTVLVAGTALVFNPSQGGGPPDPPASKARSFGFIIH